MTDDHTEDEAIRGYVLSQSDDGEIVRHAEKLVTKHLAIAYKPVDWPFATDPIPKPITRKD